MQQESITYLKQRARQKQRLFCIYLAVASTLATLFLPWYALAVGFGVLLIGASTQLPRQQSQPSQAPVTSPPQPEENQEVTTDTENPTMTTVAFEFYRHSEANHVKAALLADNSMLVVGSEGIGKTEIAKAVYKSLEDEGFVVIWVEQTTPKEMLKQIAQELGVSIYEDSLERKKMLTINELQTAIERYLLENYSGNHKAFFILDNAHRCDVRFRNWLKNFRGKGMQLLLFANEPPKTDIFISIPRIELGPLPDYAIRRILEQAAIERGLTHLRDHDFARLSQRCAGIPMFAKRVIDEEHLGLEPEAGDHDNWIDLTPYFLGVGVIFVVYRFIAVGTHNPGLYILMGSAGGIFAVLSHAMRAVPKEDKRRIR